MQLQIMELIAFPSIVVEALDSRRSQIVPW